MKFIKISNFMRMTETSIPFSLQVLKLLFLHNYQYKLKCLFDRLRMVKISPYHCDKLPEHKIQGGWNYSPKKVPKSVANSSNTWRIVPMLGEQFLCLANSSNPTVDDTLNFSIKAFYVPFLTKNFQEDCIMTKCDTFICLWSNNELNADL